MDPGQWRNISYIVVLAGAALVVLGTVGTYYFTAQKEMIAPFRQPIKTAEAEIEVAVTSPVQVNTEFLDKGAAVVFSKDNEPLLRMSANGSSARQTGENQVIFRATFSMTTSDSGAGTPLQALKAVDRIRLFFQKMPEESNVVGGKISCILNGEVRLEFVVPPQQTTDGLVLVRDFEGAFSRFR